MLSLHIRMSGAETHGPVDQVEHQEHDGEHHEEHIIHLVKKNYGLALGQIKWNL